MVRRQTISTMDLLDFAQEDNGESVPLRMGVREIHGMIEQHRADKMVQLQTSGVSQMVRYINGRGQTSRITALYWSVSTIDLEGVLDQIRTRLAEPAIGKTVQRDTVLADGTRQVVVETEQPPGCPSCSVVASRRKERRVQRLRDQLVDAVIRSGRAVSETAAAFAVSWWRSGRR
jgi:hypothetical protein